jgi:type I restriction enzyme S subunit
MSYPHVRIGEILELKYGKSLPSNIRSGAGYKVYGSNGMTGLHEKTITSSPSIIVGRKGSIGEIHYSEKPCWPIDTTYYVDSFGDSVAPRWLYHRLQNLDLKALNKAVAIPGLNRNDVYQLGIPLPPLEEQRRIAAILDKAASLEKLSQSSITKLYQTLESSFRHLSSITACDCVLKSLEEVVEAIIDYRGKSPEKTVEGIPLITARLIKEGRILEATEFIAPESYSEWMRRGMPKRGDVVFTTEAPLGPLCQES